MKRELNFFPVEDNAPPLDKEEFLTKLRELNIGEWRRNYDTQRFGLFVCDGVQWRMCIEFNDGIRAVSFSGDNACPYNFDKLLELLDVDGVNVPFFVDVKRDEN